MGCSYLFIAHDLSIGRVPLRPRRGDVPGRGRRDGTREELFDAPLHPYTQALLSAALMPDPEVQRSRRADRAAGRHPEPGGPAVGLPLPHALPAVGRVVAALCGGAAGLQGDGHLVACHLVEEGASMSFTTRPELRGTFGMVASTHWLASSAGMGVLERGGNAFDAAVAAGFVLQVVEPHLNGPGGDVPVIFSSAAAGEVRVLCGQGPAPAAATIDAYTTRARSRSGHRSAGRGRAGRLRRLGADAARLRDLGARGRDGAAIAYAGDGYPLVPGIVAAINGVEDLLRTEWTSSAESTCRCPRRRAVPQRPARGDLRAHRALRRRAERARRASTPPATPSTAAAWRRRSTASSPSRTALLTAARTWRAGRRRSSRRSRSTTTATRSARPARGGRAR